MVAGPVPEPDPEVVGIEDREMAQPGDDLAVDESNGQPPAVDTGRRRRIGRIVAVGLALAALGASWTLASPIGAAPDDSFHLASIWCSPTAPDDACTNVGDSFAAGKDFVEVPAEIGPGAHCYAFNPYLSAGCQEAIEPGTTVVTLADDGVYPGLYYSVLGLTVTGQPVNSALLARFVSWMMCIGFLAAGWLVLPRRHRLGYLVTLLVTAVPMALFLWASTNPSGVVVASISAAWCAVVSMVHAETRRRVIPAAVLLGVSLVAAVGSRADGGLYALVAVVAACTLLWRKDRHTALKMLATLSAAVLGLIVSLLVLTRRGDTVEDLVSTAGAVDGASSGGLLWNNLREILFVIPGSLGRGPIGWLDTAMPSVVWLPTLAVFFGLLFWGIGRMDRMKALSLLCVLGGLVVVPYLQLWRTGYAVGSDFQPRYVLPLVPVLGYTALYWRRATSVGRLTNVQLSTVLGLMTMAQSVALHTNIRRYVTGVGDYSIDLDTGRGWWWNIPITPNAVWALGSVAFGVLAITLGLSVRRSSDPEHDSQEFGDRP